MTSRLALSPYNNKKKSWIQSLDGNGLSAELHVFFSGLCGFHPGDPVSSKNMYSSVNILSLDQMCWSRSGSSPQVRQAGRPLLLRREWVRCREQILLYMTVYMWEIGQRLWGREIEVVPSQWKQLADTVLCWSADNNRFLYIMIRIMQIKWKKAPHFMTLHVYFYEPKSWNASM